jgi:hypothetical protein
MPSKLMTSRSSADSAKAILEKASEPRLRLKMNFENNKIFFCILSVPLK